MPPNPKHLGFMSANGYLFDALRIKTIQFISVGLNLLLKFFKLWICLEYSRRFQPSPLLLSVLVHEQSKLDAIALI